MAEERAVEVKKDILEIALFDPTKKKKKKKKKKQPQDQLDEFVSRLAEETENLTISDGVESCSSTKDDNTCEEGGEEIVFRHPWDVSDRDYAYRELLSRLFNILRENNPELAGDRCRTLMRPPQVLREGTKKTIFVNFMDLCKTMHRQPEDVMTFLLAEMGTSGSLDTQQRLVVKGTFAPKNIEGILRRYINEYVKCSICKSPDTILAKENCLFFLQCEQCGSGRSVTARVGNRNTVI